MVQRGLSDLRPKEVTLTHEKSSQTRREAEPVKMVNYKKFDAVITITNGAAWFIEF